MHARCISWIKWEGKREEEEAFHWQDYRPRHDWRNWREKWNDTIHDWPPPLANWFVTASCVNDLRGTSVCRPSWEQVKMGSISGWPEGDGRRGTGFTWRVILRRPKLGSFGKTPSFKKLFSNRDFEILNRDTQSNFLLVFLRKIWKICGWLLTFLKIEALLKIFPILIFINNCLDVFHFQSACVIHSRKHLHLQSIENNLIKNPTYLRSRIPLGKEFPL